jgi:ribulose-5-phosphate 4-epimerase/fuculose-1-phosphate aldolase
LFVLNPGKTEALLEIARIDLVIANRVLARIGAVDAYGHVSVRHPTEPSRFLLSRSRSPRLVDRGDIMQFDLEGGVIGSDNRPPYSERFIHAALYAARTDVHAIAHGHAQVLLPFAVTDVRIRPLFMTADEFGANVPLWDIRTTFGSGTNVLITNMDQARDLASAFGRNDRAVLLRGHGFVAAGRSASQLIRMCKALLENAAVQLEASRLGPLNEMTAEEIEARRRTIGADDDHPSMMRGFEYEAIEAGLEELLRERAELKARQAVGVPNAQ